MLEFSPTAPVKPGFHYIFWGYKKVSNTELGKKTQRKNTTKQNKTQPQRLSFHRKSCCMLIVTKKTSPATQQLGHQREIQPNQTNYSLLVLLRLRVSARHNFKPGLSNQRHMENAGNYLQVACKHIKIFHVSSMKANLKRAKYRPTNCILLYPVCEGSSCTHPY